MTAQQEKFKKKATTIYLSEKLHFNAKIAALREHKTLNEAVTGLIEKWTAELDREVDNRAA
jgi:hypothetical protein